MKSYKQLTYEQRCQIYALKKTNNSQQVIANVIGVNQSVISRELNVIAVSEAIALNRHKH